MIIALALLLLGGAQNPVYAGENLTETWSTWIGGHYSSFSDNPKKIGEYNLGEEEFLPEFTINYLGVGTDNIFRLDGQYYDDKNIKGAVTAKIGDRFSLSARYRSLVHQEGQDLLTNFESREWLGTVPGGKIITHEISDPNADYNTHRQEILSRIGVLLSEKHNVRLMASHRMIREQGTEQGVSNSHCFSCHLVSETVAVQNTTHALEAGLQADLKPELTVGYEFGYRYFQSQAADAVAYYDPVVHPSNGGSGAEFGSRQVFGDSSLVYSTLPTTEKINNKINVKARLGDNTKLATALGYNYTKNKNTLLQSDAWYGSAQLASVLSRRSRLLVKVTGLRQRTDDPFIDLPTYREGRPGLQTDFDYTRYSSLDRADGRGSVELIHRLNPTLVLSGLIGFERVNRYDYPVLGDGTDSKTIIGRAGLRYRKGTKFSGWARYRFEKTADPFVSGKGMFEARGREALSRVLPEGVTVFAFRSYWEREALRYQDITTAPTQSHEFSLHGDLKASARLSLTGDLKITYDKNNDLDSLEVKQSSIQPSLALMFAPNPQVAISAGYSLQAAKSRGPVAIALFDG
jgi:hypothetical protein